MKLIDIEQLEFEPFNFGDDENPEIRNYISEEDLRNASEVDPVKHAGWIVKARTMLSYSNQLSITSRCSNCNNLGRADVVTVDLWNMGYKDSYSPDRDKFCRECGHKMDLPDELYF